MSHKFFNLYDLKCKGCFKIQVHISIKAKQEFYMTYMFEN